MGGRRTLSTRVIAVVGTVAVAGLVSLALTAPAGATNVGDEASFRAAWTNAAETQIDLTADITLTCQAGPGTGAATRASGVPITVNGHGFTIRQTCTFSRVLEQNLLGTITFVGVTITGGNFGANGAGIHSSAPVVLVDSVVTGNNAGGSGGGILGFSSVDLTRSTVSGNTAGDNGGGITGGSMTFVASTVSGNQATGVGGGVFSFADAGPATSVTATNSTFSGNTAGRDGGGIHSRGNLTLVYVTLAGNTAPDGANLRVANRAGGPASILSSFGSVVALPQGGANCSNAGTTTSNGYNFSDDASCGFTAATDRQTAGDPGLGALGANGGPTQTRLPVTGSPLIGGIPDASCQADGAAGVSTDQRGVTRPQPSGCDIGAVEVEAPVVPVVLQPTFTG